MYSWNDSDVENTRFFKYSNFITFAVGACSALLIAIILNSFFADVFIENPIIINILYIPAFAIGFLYGLKITEKAIHPSETRSGLKRKIMKVFLFFLVIGGLFSSVSFALHGGALAPETQLSIENIFIVVSPENAEAIRHELGDGFEYVVQPDSKGTGDALE